MRIVVGLLICAFLIYPASAVSRPRYESAAPVAYMVDMASGAVLFDKESRRPIPPASMAKMMTAYVVFDLITKRQLKADTKFMVRPDTWKAWHNKGSTMFLKPNEQVSVADLLHGVVTLSGNDAAIVLAQGIAGSEDAFVRQMNSTAKALGMKDSRFGTANGWPDKGRTVTTARDLAVLGARTIHDFPALYRQYYGRNEFSWNNVSQPNRNPLLTQIVGADGMKTGQTGEAGYCFAGTAERNGRRIMMVVAGLNSINARTEESIRFLNWGFAAWRAQPLYNPLTLVTSIPVQLGTENRVALAAPRLLALALPATDTPRYKLFVRYAGPVRAPLKKGDEVAKLVAKFSDGSEQIMPLVTAHSVGGAGFFGRAWNGLKSLVSA